MFSKLINVLALFVLAAATPLPGEENGGAGGSGGNCNTGPVQCCNSVQPAGSPAASHALSLLNIVVQGVNIPIGINCSPITVGGIGDGSGCSSNPVCCQDNSFNGVVAIGCVSVNVNL